MNATETVTFSIEKAIEKLFFKIKEADLIAIECAIATNS